MTTLIERISPPNHNLSSILLPLTILSILFVQLLLSNGESSETIVLHPANFSRIKIRFDFDSQEKFFLGGGSNDDFFGNKKPTIIENAQSFDAVVIRTIITDKLLKMKDFLLGGQQTNLNFSNTTNQMFLEQNTTINTENNDSQVLFDSFISTINGPDYRLNVTIDTVQISGLSTYNIADIAINQKSKKLSALLRMPSLRITMFYKAQGIRSTTKRSEVYSDKGKIIYIVHGWRTVLVGKILNISNQSRIDIAGFGMRSHYNYIDSNMITFSNPQSGEQDHRIDIGKVVSSSIMKKIINEVDDRLESIMLDELGFHEIGTWLNSNERNRMFETSSDSDDGESGSVEPLEMMESMTHHSINKNRKRTRRQVPCEVGEELDEYVDSLFRFLKRLIRVMEPFNLPNTTIELEEYNLQIFLHSGTGTRAYNFERKKPAWVLCQNETISLGLTVGLEDVRVNYKYRVIQDWRLMFDGDLEAQIRRPKAQIQITQLSPPENNDEELDFENDEEEEETPVQQRVDKIKVWKPGQIVVLIRGLGNFSSALSMLINQMLTDTSVLDPLIQMLETDGVVAVNEMLKNVSIPIFSII
ncbi:hypothetical protein SSS_06533 [Sarcoptes scabiei]|uniref:Uncharacterized protein n=1 Tax=Sarcoptes scabiei TaxID=52283 RepID=A0A834R2Z6_SARSC|nr:hypothetical protein SSS_06533 [Sarcoptes scabiei]